MKVKMNKKSLTTALALTIVASLAVGGTIAWITDSTETTKSTFSVGDINISIDASDAYTNHNNELLYDVMPGSAITVDPRVIVEPNSEYHWLFVNVEGVNNEVTGLTDGVLDYEIDTAIWTPVAGSDTVWYTAVDAQTAARGKTYGILESDSVVVNSNITKDMLSVVANAATKPYIEVKAFAHQQANTDLATATAAATAFFAAN